LAVDDTTPVMATMIHALFWIAGNLFLYAVVLRHRPAFTRERMILGYHVLSFVIMPWCLALLSASREILWAPLIGAMSLHGIYSLSFLELWSLSEGGYSLRMLDRVERIGRLPLEAEIKEWREIGAAKTSQRLRSLEGNRLIRKTGGIYQITSMGRIAAAGLRALAWVAHLKEGSR
jgi:hypothetical protein